MAEAQKLAEEAEAVIRDMLAAKPVDAITPDDVASALGMHPRVTPVVASEEAAIVPPSRDLKPRTNSGKRLAELKSMHKAAPIAPKSNGHHHGHASPVVPTLHHLRQILAVEKDLGLAASQRKRSKSSESYSWWSYTPLSYFYTSDAVVHVEGTYEHHIQNAAYNMSPPLLQAWEAISIEKSVELASDALLDQILDLVTGMVAVAISQPKSDEKILLKDVPHDQRSLMMSVIVAQLVSDAGIGSLESGESLSWSYLLAACIDMSDEEDATGVSRELQFELNCQQGDYRVDIDMSNNAIEESY